MTAALVPFLALGLCACGSGPFIADDIAVFDAEGTDSTLPHDGGDAGDAAGGADASDATKFNGGGPFLCDTCVCDGTANMCFHGGGGPQPAPLDDGGFGDAGACDMDAGSSCTAIPIDCLPNPTCACVMTHYPSPSCSCQVDPSGNGLFVQCNYP